MKSNLYGALITSHRLQHERQKVVAQPVAAVVPTHDECVQVAARCRHERQRGAG